jgi:hypothetical protein
MRPRRLPRLPRKNDQQISNQNDNAPNKNQSINNEQALPQQDDSNIRNIDSDFIRKKNKIRERHR